MTFLWLDDPDDCPWCNEGDCDDWYDWIPEEFDDAASDTE